jgi:hypothetical protein
MNISIEQWSHEIIEDQILEFELKHRIQIPEPYRSFLLENNVCVTEPDAFFTKHVDKITQEDVPDDELGVFRGFSYDNEEWNLEWLYSIYVIAKIISNEYLPISLDGAGNVICIGVSEGKMGKIYFWLHEDELKEPFCLADSFHSFINSIG